MKEQIKQWLKRENHDRYWLAEQLSVDKRTVDNWLSSPKEIPPAKLTLIERLMQDDAAAEAQRQQQLSPANQLFSVEVDLPRFRRYNKASALQNQTLEEWARAELDKAAEEFFRTGQLPEVIERHTTIAGQPLTILSSPQYQGAAVENLKVAEESDPNDLNATIRRLTRKPEDPETQQGAKPA